MSAGFVTDEDASALAGRIYACAWGLLRQCRKNAASRFLTLERINLLKIVAEHGPVSVTDLAREGSVHGSTASRMVATLIADGALRRLVNAKDGRGVLVAITPRGKRSLQNAHKETLIDLAESIARLDSPQRGTLTDALSLLERMKSSRS